MHPDERDFWLLMAVAVMGFLAGVGGILLLYGVR
jgi:hypothetical protein